MEVNEFDVNGQKGLYIFEEYIEGESLRNYLDNNKMGLEEALKLTEQILKIIVQMEKRHIVHRDIKPDNILRSKSGEWYLIDFGIARALDMNSLTLTAMRIGPHTPGYGAPCFNTPKRILIVEQIFFHLGLLYLKQLQGHILLYVEMKLI